MQNTMPSFTIIISFLQTITIAKSELLLNIQEDRSQASECLIKFMKDPNLQTVFVFENTDYYEHTVQQILTVLKPNEEITLNTGIIICDYYKSCLNSNKFTKIEQFFIFTNTAKQLHFILNTCLCSKWWNRARFVIIIDQMTENIQILNILKDNLIVKALMVTSWNESYVYFKFTLPRCPEIIQPDDIQLYNCSSNNFHQKDMFKSSEMIKKCNLKIGVRVAPPYTHKLTKTEQKSMNLSHPYTGIELVALSKAVNFSYDPSTPIHSQKTGQDNSHSTEVSYLMQLLVNRDIDVLVGALHVSKEEIKSVSGSYPYRYGNLIAIVQKRSNPSYLSLHKIFNWSVWLFVVSFVIVFVLIVYIYSFYEKTKCVNVTFTVLQLFTILMGQSTRVFKKYLKLPLLTWIWITYIIRSSYEARIKSFFFVEDKSSQVNSLKEICENKYKILTQNYIYDYFKEGLQISDCYIPPNRFYSSENCLKDLLSKREDVAVFTYLQTFLHEQDENLNEEGQNPFHVIPQQVGQVPLTIYFNEKDPIKSIIQKKAIIIHETGLVNHHLKFQAYRKYLKLVTKMKKKLNNPSMSIEHLWFCFRLYILGVSISVSVFCLELIYFKFLIKFIFFISH